MRNYYIIIYTMKKHNFTLTYVINFLIVLLSFLVQAHNTYNYSAYLVLFLLYNIIIKDKKYSKFLKQVMIKYINTYNDDNYFLQH